MKKVIIAMLIVLMVPASIFASRGIFDLTLGANVESSYDVKTVQDAIANGEAPEFSMDNLSFGAAAEVKLAFVSVNATAGIAPKLKTISGTASAGLALDVFFVRLKAGLGYEYQYDYENKVFQFGHGNDVASEFKDFKKASMDATVGVDFLLGGLTVGVHASLPTSVTIESENWGELVSSIKDNYDTAKLGVSIGIALL